MSPKWLEAVPSRRLLLIIFIVLLTRWTAAQSCDDQNPLGSSHSLRTPYDKMTTFGITLVTRVLPPPPASPSAPAPKKQKLAPTCSDIPTGGAVTFMDMIGTKSGTPTYLVDKSLLMVDFMTKTSRPVVYVHYPPGWGKTINLGMMAFFFGMQISESGDGNGVPQPLTDVSSTASHQFFANGQTPNGGQLETLLSITMDRRDFVTEHAARWPVIHFDFGLAVSNTFDGMLEDMKLALSELYQEHSYLLAMLRDDAKGKRGDKRTLLDSEIADFNSLRLHRGKNAGRIEVMDSLNFLITLMKRYLKKDVILLIDNYDKPVNYLMAVSEKKEFEAAINLFDKLLVRTFSNKAVHRAMLAGEMSVAKTSMYGVDENSAGELNFGNHRFARRWGFYSAEVDALFQLAGITTDNTELAKDYYGSYLTLTILTDGTARDLPFYCPDSVAHFVNSVVVDVYGGRTNYIDELLFQLFYMPSINQALLELLDNGRVEVVFDKKTQANRGGFLKLVEASKEMPSDVEEIHLYHFLNILHFRGYLTYVEEMNANGFRMQYVQIASTQAWRSLYSETKAGFIRRFTLSGSKALEKAGDKFKAMINEEKSCNIDEFVAAYLSLIKGIKPVDIGDDRSSAGEDPNEDLFHCMMVAVVLEARELSMKVATEKIYVLSPDEKHKPDVSVINLDNRMALIIEMKYETELGTGRAAQQLQKYRRTFDNRKVRKVKVIGINVYREDNKWKIQKTCDFQDYDYGKNPPGSG